MENWFTADTHWSHSNVIRYCKRPQYNPNDYIEEGHSLHWISKERKFERTTEMDEMLIENWNALIKKSDNVYHLGDFCFAPLRLPKILERLNGKIHLILGNHDEKQQQILLATGKFIWIKVYQRLRLEQNKIILCHYPFASWDGSCHGSFCLHGHCHGNYHANGKILDVGVDNHNYSPWNYEEIKEYLRIKNINKI